ncbi:MAG TPA: hypothetical protein VMM80_12500, partial [Bacteroidota bacterium]|nr:hypothetical protein [Bacteroidota bacterium]
MRRHRTTLCGLLLPALACGMLAAHAQENADCLACHADRSLTATRGGKTVSLCVDGKKFAASVHGSVPCVGCHADLQGKELPHAVPLARVECGA